MKIELHDTNDIAEFIALLSPAVLRRYNKELETDSNGAGDSTQRDADVAAGYKERDKAGIHQQLADGLISREFAATKLAELHDGLPTDNATPGVMSDATDELPELDAETLCEDEGCDHYGVPHVCISAPPTPGCYGEREQEAVAFPYNLPTDIAPPESYVEPVVAKPDATDELPERDADGARYDPRWHSEPKKLTDKGVFRARRGRDNDAYKAWLSEQVAEAAEAAIAADEADPVATETHALPQDKCWDEGCVHNEVPHQCVVPTEPESNPRDGSAVAHGALPVSAVNLEALITASSEVARDVSDSHIDLLNACREFTSKYGHPAFTALKAAVAPDITTGQGKAVQQFTPEERRLMQACIANYPA